MKHILSLIAVFAVVLLASTIGHAQVTLLYESFEDPGSPNLPTGWSSTQNKVGGTNDWKDSTIAGSSGTRVCYGIGPNTQQIVTSPVVDFTGYLADSVIFFGRKSGTFNSTLGVEVSTDGGTSWTNIDTAIAGTLPNAMKRYAFAIPSIVNGQSNVKFRYNMYGNGTNATGTTRLDEFEVRGLSTIISDGDGSATVHSGAGALTGTDMFTRNTSQTVVVTVIGTAAGSLDKVKVTVPAAFTGYNALNVTLDGAFSGKINSGSGNDIQINSAALGTTPGTITITSLTSPNPNSSGQNGNDTWTVQTAKTAGTLTNIGSLPITYTIIPISNLRTGGTDGFGNSDAGLTPVLDGNTVAVDGIITVPNRVLAETTSTSVIIQDGSYGLQVFKTGNNSYSTLTLGKEIVVKGGISGFFGNMEIIPASVVSPDIIIVGTPGAPSPTVIANATDISEANEGKLVQINSVNWDSAAQTFIALSSNRGRNNFMKGIDSGTVYLNTVNNAVGNTIPSTSNIVGVVYHRTDIAGGGIQPYKIAPRSQVDLGFSAGDGSGTATITPSIRYGSLVSVAETLVVTGDGVSTIAEVSVTIPSTWTWTNTASRVTSGTGFNFASVAVTGDGSGGNPYVITISGIVGVTAVNTGTLIISNLNTPSTTGLTTFTVKTRASGGVLSPINVSPTVNIATGFEAYQTGNWNSGSTWLGGVAPGASDDVSFSTKDVVVTITANAQCKNLIMTGIDTTGGHTGPVLQFDPSATVSLTVNGRLDLSGSPGRPLLTSNGNVNATLITKGYMFTNVSNTAANGNRGLSMNEGTVKMLGSTSDSLRTGAGFRLGNLFVGDGTDTKSVIWVQTSSATMNVHSLTVKQGSSLILGGTTQAQGNSIGNSNTSGLPMLTGGVTIENGASITTNNASAAGQVAFINIKGGGLTNNGTMNLISGDLSRRYKVAFGGLLADTAYSKQTYGGTGTSTFYHVTVGGSTGGDTLVVNKSMPLDTMTVYAKGVLQETPGFTARGTVTATRHVALSATENFGGIGAVISPAGDSLGWTTVVRKDSVTTSGNNSIRRRFDITPTNNTGLNATFEFHYDDSELGGQNEATFETWKSVDNGATWASQGGTVDAGNNKITLTGVNDFSQWTVSDAGHPLTGNTVTRDYAMNNRWNMISVPLTVPDYTKTVLYSAATSPAYAYSGSYVTQTVLDNGPGYWLKFGLAQNVSMTGDVRLLDTIDVVQGWNMIGSISDSVTTAGIVKLPGTMTLSVFYTYSGSYVQSDKVRPGGGYWVKASVAGKLVLATGASAAPKQTQPEADAIGCYNTLTITDNEGNSQTLYFGANEAGKFVADRYELPPTPPQGLFDARFASQRYAESYPANIDKAEEFPIAIHASAYPVTVRWHIADGSKQSFVMTDGFDGKLVGTQSLSKDGMMTITNSKVDNLVLKVSGSSNLPTEFALSANFPNPFNPTTKFVIALPVDAPVSVVVFDILGRQVSTLLNEEKAAGYHTIEWNGLTNNGTPAGSGVYFVRMSSGSFSAIHKMVMMK